MLHIRSKKPHRCVKTAHMRTRAQARKCTMLASVTLPLPRPLAHYVRSLGLRRAVGSLSLRCRSVFFFLHWSYQELRCIWDRAICRMVKGWRERQQLTPPSEGTGSLPLSICRTEPRPSITGRVSGRTRACVTYASSPHHLTRHATTYRELPPRSNSTNLAALHTVFVATHQVSAVDETLCAGSGTLTRAVAVVTAPPTANGLCKHASICKKRIFSGIWEAVRRKNS